MKAQARINPELSDNNQQLLEYIKDLQEKDKMNKQLLQNLLENPNSKSSQSNIMKSALGLIK